MLIIGTNTKFRKIRFMIMLCGVLLGYVLGYIVSRYEGSTAWSLLFVFIIGVPVVVITDYLTKKEVQEEKYG